MIEYSLLELLGPIELSALQWFVLAGWAAVGYVACSYLLGWHDFAYKTGKYAIVFMIGASMGVAVV